MNIDVFNNKMVFDLLGDIYELSINGGEAVPLISGVAWQTQPRFSPDGKYLIYSSDESGCDNVWVYSFELGKSMQVTYEPFFYVTNAKWKNVTHIVANKWHLVLDRGIAGGEVWEYAVPQNWSEEKNEMGDWRGKNEGRALAQRTNLLAQFGPEEPIFDVNSGKYLYYSMNMVDTVRWTYNKDPHAGIYSILKVDVSMPSPFTPSFVTGGPGGAARPIISSNGHILAFIKRSLFDTSLVLHNLTSGNEVNIFNLNYQDQQESYAPCGVFPSFSFIEITPNSTSNPIAIIAWAGGKIWKIPLPSSIDSPSSPASPPSIIPFTVNVVRHLAPVTRFQRSPKIGYSEDGSSFETKVALHPSRNLANTHLAFSTLGDIYLANFTGGTGGVNRTLSAPTKMTIHGDFNLNPANTLYYWPNIDNNADRMVRTAWSDEDYGWIEIVKLKGNVAQPVEKLTSSPGRFIKPSFNLDGDQIIYAKSSGDGASGSRFTSKPGIYLTNLGANGLPIPGQSDMFVGEGSEAFFSVNAGSSAFVVTSPSYPYLLEEVSLNRATLGKTVRHLVDGQYVTNVAISPRRQVIAFVEFEVVYAQQISEDMKEEDWPMKLTARMDNAVGSGRTQILSKVGGDFLEFSGNSLSFGWANNFTTVDLSPMTSREWGCPDQYCFMNNQFMTSYSLAQNVSSGTAIETILVFENATVIPFDERNGTTTQVYMNQKILVKGDTILAVGDEVDIPVGAQVINLQGGYVLPGFIDAHAHWDSAFTQRWGKTKQGWEFLMNLAFGVTSLHNPSAEFWSVWSDAELIKSGKKIGPRIFSTATAMFGGGGDSHCEVATVGEAQEALIRRAAFGGFSAKSYMIQCRAGRQKVLAAAQLEQFDVVPEGGMHFSWDLSFIVDGHTTVEHSLPMAPFYDDILQLFSHSQTAWTPTMVVSFGGLWGDRFFYQDSNVFLDPTVQHWIPNDAVRPVSMRRIEADVRDYHVFSIAKAAANVSSSGTLVNIGAHGQMQGIGYLWELKLMKAGGMSNYDALKTATINPAKSLGLDKQIGSIFPGKLADLVILEPGVNPLDDLEALRSIKYVMLDGRLYDAETFAQVLPTPQPPPILTVINNPTL
jgi:Tol biopolymer transport system component